MACADVATTKAKPAAVINLIIGLLPCLSSANYALSRLAKVDLHQPFARLTEATLTPGVRYIWICRRHRPCIARWENRHASETPYRRHSGRCLLCSGDP